MSLDVVDLCIELFPTYGAKTTHGVVPHYWHQGPRGSLGVQISSQHQGCLLTSGPLVDLGLTLAGLLSLHLSSCWCQCYFWHWGSSSGVRSPPGIRAIPSIDARLGVRSSNGTRLILALCIFLWRGYLPLSRGLQKKKKKGLQTVKTHAYTLFFSKTSPRFLQILILRCFLYH